MQAFALQMFAIGEATADAPPFDRPGIAFSTGTLPAGSFALEQGLPDIVRSSKSDDSSTSYSADSRFRVGITDDLEVQVETSPFNSSTTHSLGATHSADGRGDVSIATKIALPTGQQRLSGAMLAVVTFANGANRFTNGATAYDLGVTMGYSLDDDVDAEFYCNVNRLDGATSFDVSPNLNVQISQTFAGFVEAGATFADHGTDDVVAGGGFTWMITPAVQLDMSADFGLTDRSPRITAGFGVSIFVK